MSDSSRNHSETNPAVGGSPASVSDPMASPVPLQGVRRPMPRKVSRSSLPAAVSIPALAVNSSDLAAVCAIICRVAASRPTAISRWSRTAAPVSATPKPTMMRPLFSTLE